MAETGTLQMGRERMAEEDGLVREEAAQKIRKQAHHGLVGDYALTGTYNANYDILPETGSFGDGSFSRTLDVTDDSTAWEFGSNQTRKYLQKTEFHDPLLVEEDGNALTGAYTLTESGSSSASSLNRIEVNQTMRVTRDANTLAADTKIRKVGNDLHGGYSLGPVSGYAMLSSDSKFTEIRSNQGRTVTETLSLTSTGSHTNVGNAEANHTATTRSVTGRILLKATPIKEDNDACESRSDSRVWMG